MIARLLLLCLLLLSGLRGAAQVAPATVEALDTISSTTPRRRILSPGFIHYAERMPVFEGGAEGLYCFLYRNNRFATLLASYPSGRVFIAFVVDTVGQVQNVRLLKSLHPELDAEALRLVRLLSGHFTPGYQNKRPVAVPFTLPIQFPAVVPDKKQLKRCQ